MTLARIIVLLLLPFGALAQENKLKVDPLRLGTVKISLQAAPIDNLTLCVVPFRTYPGQVVSFKDHWCDQTRIGFAEVHLSQPIEEWNNDWTISVMVMPSEESLPKAVPRIYELFVEPTGQVRQKYPRGI